jgi:bifunctional non-homologous end joining protein LigD
VDVSAASDDPESDLDRGKLSFTLQGGKLRGGFTLVRMRGGNGQWLLIKQADELAERGWRISSALTPALRKQRHS